MATGTENDDFLTGTEGPDTLEGGAGNDTIFGFQGDDHVDGGAGVDHLDSDGDNDTLLGGDGQDFLAGGTGDDVLDGGAGNDTLDGGEGNDTYVLAAGTGSDSVTDSGGVDRVLLADGIDPSSVYLTRDVNSDLVVGIKGTDDRLVLGGGLTPQVEFIQFNVNGTAVEYDAAAIEVALANQAPTAQADSASITEDSAAPVTGNVLANDSDPDGATGLSVTDAGERQGLYGKLTLNADGTYSYSLVSSLAAVQALKAGETLTETFDYSMTDGGLNALEATAQLGITIQGADEAPSGRRIIGTNRNDHLVGTDGDDTIDGRKGFDTMIGGKGDDVYYVDATRGRHDHGHWWDCGRGRRGHRTDQVVERANEGYDTVYSSASYILPANVEALHLLGSKGIDGTGNSAANWIEGNKGNNDLAGGGGNDLLQGGKGNDSLRGDTGIDVLQGGKGNDDLKDKDGSTVFDGGRGNDEMEGGASAGFFAGGRGNDELELGGGHDVIAFNKGDGVDRIEGECQSGVLSLGGGIRYEDLRLRKDGKDLILETGGSDRLVFDDWYKGKQSVVTLQVVAEAMEGYSQDSSNELLNDRIERFDFRQLVDAFDDARSSKKNMDSWKLMGELLDAHLCGSDDSALGGDLAYRYGMTGTLAGMSWDAAQGTVAAAGFGAQKQALQPLAQLPDDSVKLAG